VMGRSSERYEDTRSERLEAELSGLACDLDRAKQLHHDMAWRIHEARMNIIAIKSAVGLGVSISDDDRRAIMAAIDNLQAILDM